MKQNLFKVNNKSLELMIKYLFKINYKAMRTMYIDLIQLFLMLTSNKNNSYSVILKTSIVSANFGRNY